MIKWAFMMSFGSLALIAIVVGLVGIASIWLDHGDLLPLALLLPLGLVQIVFAIAVWKDN